MGSLSHFFITSIRGAGAPHPPQNRSFASLANPHCEQATGNACPQAEQNFRPALFSVWHWGHCILSPPADSPSLPVWVCFFLFQLFPKTARPLRRTLILVGRYTTSHQLNTQKEKVRLDYIVAAVAMNVVQFLLLP